MIAGVVLHLMSVHMENLQVAVYHMLVSLNRGPQHRPQTSIILVIGTAKKAPFILGTLNPKYYTN